MKHKKAVTQKVLDANRANSRSSTGPSTEQGKSHSSHNAVRHGILARKVVRPKGLLEKFFVEEIATIFLKLGITEGLQVRELLRRQELSDEVDSIFHKDLKLPISGYDLPLDRGWDCERLVVRAVSGKDTSDSRASRGPAVFQGQVINAVQNSQNSNSQKAGNLEFEAVLGNSLANMTRYQSALKRDLYRAIETLRKIQAERREREKRHSPRKHHRRQSSAL